MIKSPHLISRHVLPSGCPQVCALAGPKPWRSECQQMWMSSKNPSFDVWKISGRFLMHNNEATYVVSTGGKSERKNIQARSGHKMCGGPSALPPTTGIRKHRQ